MTLTNSDSYTSLPAEDLDRAKNFYENILGLEIIVDASPNIIMFKSGSGSVFVYPREKTKADHTVLGFIVQDVESTVKSLKAKGVKFEDYEGVTDDNNISSQGPGKIAWFKDSEGNVIAINTSFK